MLNLLNKIRFLGIFALIIITFPNIVHAESGSLIHDVKTKVAPPRQQVESGISSDAISCNSGLILVKRLDAVPACVKPTSIYSLFNRGWILPESVDFNNVALTVAEWFVKTSPTFSFDGINDTLQIEITRIQESFPERFVIKAEFDSRHGGYGDRTDQIVTQVITPHSMDLVVTNGKVMSAIIDGKWDEINQISLSGDEAESQTADFILEYKKEGGIAGISDSITIISIANEILIQSFDGQTSATVDDIFLTELWQAIKENKFLESESKSYPPIEGSADYFTYTLAIFTEDKEIQVIWTDTSETMPADAEAIVQKISELLALAQVKISFDKTMLACCSSI